MDTTVRNVDEQCYRAIRVRAVVEGKTVGEVMNEAMRVYLARTSAPNRHGSLRALQPEPFPEGNEHLSEDVDAIVYGSGR